MTNGPASRTYELALVKGGKVVQVDGLDSPLITLQYGTVDCCSDPIGLSILIVFVLVPDLVGPCEGLQQKDIPALALVLTGFITSDLCVHQQGQHGANGLARFKILKADRS